jgi:hypothetical protein
MTCTCGKEASAKGLCATCYQRQRRRKQGIKPAKNLNVKATVVVRLPKLTLAKVRHAAELRGITVSDIVRAAIVKLYG